jgi:hypothetical protein
MKARRVVVGLAAAGAAALTACAAAAADPASPLSFGVYVPGPPCPWMTPDRTYSQFQVNLGEEREVLEGQLASGADGAVLAVEGSGRLVRLVTNASKADWFLAYPFVDGPVGVWGRPILHPDCSEDGGALYVEAVVPRILLEGPVEARVDLMRRPDLERLRNAARRYRRALGGGAGGDVVEAARGPRWGAAGRLEEALFAPEASRAERPWRVRLLGPDEPPRGGAQVNVVLSGSDGSVGVFGHIAAGSGGWIYNVYPVGSDRGAPGPVPLGDYLFNAERGHALRRPTWILRIEGLPPRMIAAFESEVSAGIAEIVEGRTPYHPTANNCTLISLRGLGHLGFGVAAPRYFTKRFPRPAFAHILDELPGLVRSGRLPAARVELAFIPQVPVRISEGRAPNRPLRDRSKVD